MSSIRLGTGQIGDGAPCFVIAEAGVNHDGDVTKALELVELAAAARADAVKFQTFKTEHLVSARAPKARYQLAAGDPRESQMEMLRRLELPPDALRAVQARCRALGILFLSTPFDEESADLLAELDVPAMKLGSGEVTNWPLLRHVARMQRPVILSTGMATLGEVEDAVRVLREAGCRELALLHCVSCYPAAPEDVNLRALETLRAAFQVPVGFSDHTLGLSVALAAVALGACVIEKHFTLDPALPGPDHRASLGPAELHALVREIRTVERALGNGSKAPALAEAEIALVARRSLAAAVDLAAGTRLEARHLRSLRPATGLSPALVDRVLGRSTRRALRAGELLAWSDIE